MLETLLNHFVELVEQRNLLLQRIKRSKDGSHLKIEAAFQKYVYMYGEILDYKIMYNIEMSGTTFKHLSSCIFYQI